MFKIASVLLFLLFKNSLPQELCSVRKIDNTCVCKRVSDSENQDLIVSVADCARISLQSFPKLDQLQDDLNFLDLSHNEITTLSDKCSSATLDTLNLSYNRIGNISSEFFDELPNLWKLILSHNNIASLDDQRIFKNSKNLVHLDLSFNHIKTLQDGVYAPLTNLRLLDLSYNNVNLGKLLSSSPDFLHANLGITQNISHLKMDNIGLNELHISYFNNFTDLKHLSLADNHFEHVPVVPYSVEYLDLSGSDFVELQAKYLSYHSLKVLQLNRLKKLENIHHYAFYSLQSLEELYLNDCRNLNEFNDLVFGALLKNTVLPLKKLSLARSGLKTLNATYKNVFIGMELVDLRDNPWNCNCQLLWFQEVENFVKGNSMRCSSPTYLASKQIFDITAEDVPSCYPEKYGKRSHRILIPILILLVIVLFALIAYLIYYAPSWYGNRARRIGPESPYSTTRTEDE